VKRFVALHPGGTAEIQKVIMARGLSIGRHVREQAGRLYWSTIRGASSTSVA